MPVELTEDEQRALHDLIDGVARRTAPEGFTHWLSGMGSLPQWSKADAAFLGKEAAPDAPDKGEPTFDDEILSFETSCREKW